MSQLPQSLTNANSIYRPIITSLCLIPSYVACNPTKAKKHEHTRVLSKEWCFISSFLELPLVASIFSDKNPIPAIVQLYALHQLGVDIDALIDWTQQHPKRHT